MHTCMDGCAFETLFFLLFFVCFALLGLGGEVGLPGLGAGGEGLGLLTVPSRTKR